MAELRQIRTLRLRAERREQVARTAIALEDALRTASLPQLPRGAILLVRRLDLGRLPADASPQWLSRHIERRLRALQLTAVCAARRAAAAPAVWFADRSEALAALLAASLHHAPRAWYWPGVLPGWRPGMTMRALLPLRPSPCRRAAEPGAGTLASRRCSTGCCGRTGWTPCWSISIRTMLRRRRPAACRRGPAREPQRSFGPGAAETSPPSGTTRGAAPADRERCLARRADQMGPAMGSLPTGAAAGWPPMR